MKRLLLVMALFSCALNSFAQEIIKVYQPAMPVSYPLIVHLNFIVPTKNIYQLTNQKTGKTFTAQPSDSVHLIFIPALTDTGWISYRLTVIQSKQKSQVR